MIQNHPLFIFGGAPQAHGELRGCNYVVRVAVALPIAHPVLCPIRRPYDLATDYDPLTYRSLVVT